MHRLAVQSLLKSYNGHTVVDQVTFFMILGLLQPDGGKISLDGQDISNLPIYRRARLGLQYLPQEPSVFRKLTVAENVMAILETLEPDAMVRQERLEKLLA
ncbi:MAG: ATP-binding cassette domain-containing protein, partial [Deltaproteobacteria bacterium]|nr:ATP-binding cassette domain-containing protein [Deltaproteobacteria bacterium]